MEKNTLLAVLFSSLIIFVWFFFVQPKFFPAEEETGRSPEIETPVQAAPAEPVQPVTVKPVESVQTGDSAGELAEAADIPAKAVVAAAPEKEERIPIETDIIKVMLSSIGGDIVSYQLKDHKDNDEMVEMVLPSVFENGEVKENRSFTIAFGGQDAQPVATNFRVSRPAPLVVEFTGDFTDGSQNVFALKKRYEFKNGEYMFQLSVSLSSPETLNLGNTAYTLGIGPQIGPNFQKLDNRYEYRHYYSMINGKRTNVKVNTSSDSRFAWAAIAGKYFTAIVIPDNTLARA